MMKPAAQTSAAYPARTGDDRARDKVSEQTAYTTDHAGACYGFDLAVVPFVNPYVQKITSKVFGHEISLCNHNHAPGESCGEHTHSDEKEVRAENLAPQNQATSESAKPTPDESAEPPIKKPSAKKGLGSTRKPHIFCKDEACNHTTFTASAVESPKTAKDAAKPAEIAKEATEKSTAPIKELIGKAEALVVDAKPSPSAFCKLIQNSRIQWLGSELIADTLAVPLVVGAEHVAPHFMEAAGHVIAIPTKPFFEHGAHRAAKRYAESHGLSADSADVKDYETHLLNYDLSHLGEVAGWTVTSLALMVGGKKLMEPNAPVISLCAGGLAGKMLSTGILLGARAAAPVQVQAFDQFNADHIIHPVTHLAAKAMGADDRAIRHVERKEAKYERGQWKTRVEYEREQEASSAERVR